jgi:hypothetical protein
MQTSQNFHHLADRIRTGACLLRMISLTDNSPSSSVHLEESLALPDNLPPHVAWDFLGDVGALFFTLREWVLSDRTLCGPERTRVVAAGLSLGAGLSAGRLSLAEQAPVTNDPRPRKWKVPAQHRANYNGPIPGESCLGSGCVVCESAPDKSPRLCVVLVRVLDVPNLLELLQNPAESSVPGILASLELWVGKPGQGYAAENMRTATLVPFPPFRPPWSGPGDDASGPCIQWDLRKHQAVWGPVQEVPPEFPRDRLWIEAASSVSNVLSVVRVLLSQDSALSPLSTPTARWPPMHHGILTLPANWDGEVCLPRGILLVAPVLVCRQMYRLATEHLGLAPSQILWVRDTHALSRSGWFQSAHREPCLVLVSMAFLGSSAFTECLGGRIGVVPGKSANHHTRRLQAMTWASVGGFGPPVECDGGCSVATCQALSVVDVRFQGVVVAAGDWYTPYGCSVDSLPGQWAKPMPVVPTRGGGPPPGFPPQPSSPGSEEDQTACPARGLLPGRPSPLSAELRTLPAVSRLLPALEPGRGPRPASLPSPSASPPSPPSPPPQDTDRTRVHPLGILHLLEAEQMILVGDGALSPLGVLDFLQPQVDGRLFDAAGWSFSAHPNPWVLHFLLADAAHVGRDWARRHRLDLASSSAVEVSQVRRVARPRSGAPPRRPDAVQWLAFTSGSTAHFQAIETRTAFDRREAATPTRSEHQTDHSWECCVCFCGLDDLAVAGNFPVVTSCHHTVCLGCLMQMQPYAETTVLLSPGQDPVHPEEVRVQAVRTPARQQRLEAVVAALSPARRAILQQGHAEGLPGLRVVQCPCCRRDLLPYSCSLVLHASLPHWTVAPLVATLLSMMSQPPLPGSPRRLLVALVPDPVECVLLRLALAAQGFACGLPGGETGSGIDLLVTTRLDLDLSLILDRVPHWDRVVVVTELPGATSPGHIMRAVASSAQWVFGDRATTVELRVGVDTSTGGPSFERLAGSRVFFDPNSPQGVVYTNLDLSWSEQETKQSKRPRDESESSPVQSTPETRLLALDPRNRISHCHIQTMTTVRAKEILRAIRI